MAEKLLWIVVPVYNEGSAVISVVESWIRVFRKLVLGQFCFLILNDGSTDDTLKIINSLKNANPEIKIIDKKNSGHGQTCIMGYKEAIRENAQWVFQIDSDGQCDPTFFPELWNLREKHNVVYGYRKRRLDGLQRFLISRFVSVCCLLATGVWVKDANVPYRLMKVSELKKIIDRIPSDFYLANIPISIFLKKNCGIRWIDILFLQRVGFTAPVKISSFLKQGKLLAKQLKEIKW